MLSCRTGTQATAPSHFYDLGVVTHPAQKPFWWGQLTETPTCTIPFPESLLVGCTGEFQPTAENLFMRGENLDSLTEGSVLLHIDAGEWCLET